MDQLLLEVDPLEYSEDIDDRYMIKYDGYKENRLANNLKLKSQKNDGAKQTSAMDITNFYYQHPFSYSELDKLIEIIAFSDIVSEEEKYEICKKVLKTSSTYYDNPFVGKEQLKFNSRAVSGRYSGRKGSVKGNVTDNLHILQQAMNQMTQVQFTFNRYDEEGKLVPFEIISGGVPSAISETEWDPQKYMAEHLNMGYDEPKIIRIRIKNTDYNILQHWFCDNYRVLKNKSDDVYDVVEVKTSPSLIVSWALSYGEKVEILDNDIRKQINNELNSLKETYI